VEHLHSKQNIIHNEDNIDFGQTAACKSIRTIDFGKACKISDGRFYTLSVADKEKYMQKHSHIVPDLRDGARKQSVLSDIYSFGKIVLKMNA